MASNAAPFCSHFSPLLFFFPEMMIAFDWSRVYSEFELLN
jgi:hypothetical protein